MASQEGKGSIILKIFIALLVVALIIVIILPGQIWQEEEMIKSTSRGNMATLFEAYHYFHSLKGFYPEDEKELIAAIQNDSALIKKQMVVNHTNRLKNSLDSYLKTEAIKNLYNISFNLKSIEDDLETNKRYFRKFEAIDQQAEQLKQQLSVLRSEMEFANYNNAAIHLDSLQQLRRDLTDYSLQSAARLAASFATDITSSLPLIDFSSMNQSWRPISAKISNLMNEVNSTELKNVTSVSDRVADFQRDANAGFAYFLSASTSSGFEQTNKASEDLSTVYNEFLTDFLITEQYAQYALPESDSLLINISEASFYTPTDHKRYIINFADSSGLRVEDPTLLEELKTKASQEAERISQLPFMDAFAVYQAKVQELKEYYPQIKKKYRRNIDIMIKTKEIDEVLERLPNSAVYDAYLKEKAFTEIVPESDSYSEIKDQIEASLISLGSFQQVYSENFFGNLDSTHIELIDQLTSYDEMLSKIRRNTFSFGPFVEGLNDALGQIKSVPKESVLPKLEQIDNNMKSLYLYASEGEERTVYGVFKKRIVNQGKIYGATGVVSWEE
jgi:hypothetical protein